MRRPSSIETFTPSPSITLHPTLQAVLDNLDVQIEAELSRYRRQRRYPTQTVIPQQRTSLSRATKVASESSAIGILKHNIQLPTPRSSIYADPAEAAQRQPAYAPPPAAPIADRVVMPPLQPAPAAAQTLEPPHISSYAEQHDLSVYQPSVTLQKLVHQSEPVTHPPEDYLASSEELLRSIVEEDPELRADREPNSMLDTLLTPLGIGSMMLLLLSSTSLGYVIMNPGSLGFWSAPSRQASPSANQAPSASDTAAPSPNLASEEFVDLDLDNLSTLPKKSVRPDAKPNAKTKPNKTANPTARAAAKTGSSSQPAPAAPEIPVPAPQPSLSTVVVPSSPPVMSAPEPARTAPPAPAPAPVAAPVSPEPIQAEPPTAEAPSAPPSVAAAPQPAPTQQKYYYVVTEYSGDSSLQQARGAVPDAYVRNLPAEGAKVQLGAFSDQSKAQELLQELQQQGIQAEMYQP